MVRWFAFTITAPNIIFEVITAETVRNVVFWVVAPCSLLDTSVSEEHAVSIFMVEVRSVRHQMSCHIHCPCSICRHLTPPISRRIHLDLEDGGTVFFTYKITRRHKPEDHNTNGDKPLGTMKRRRFHLGFSHRELSRNSELSEPLGSVQLPVLHTRYTRTYQILPPLLRTLVNVPLHVLPPTVNFTHCEARTTEWST
jgi:hypothetical protein